MCAAKSGESSPPCVSKESSPTRSRPSKPSTGTSTRRSTICRRTAPTSTYRSVPSWRSWTVTSSARTSASSRSPWSPWVRPAGRLWSRHTPRRPPSWMCQHAAKRARLTRRQGLCSRRAARVEVAPTSSFEWAALGGSDVQGADAHQHEQMPGVAGRRLLGPDVAAAHHHVQRVQGQRHRARPEEDSDEGPAGSRQAANDQQGKTDDQQSATDGLREVERRAAVRRHDQQPLPGRVSRGGAVHARGDRVEQLGPRRRRFGRIGKQGPHHVRPSGERLRDQGGRHGKGGASGGHRDLDTSVVEIQPAQRHPGQQVRQPGNDRVVAGEGQLAQQLFGVPRAVRRPGFRSHVAGAEVGRRARAPGPPPPTRRPARKGFERAGR